MVSLPVVFFNYTGVVGILFYLSGHTRPDIAFSVNYCAIYMFCPSILHEEALKRIGWYLKLTRDCGFILNTNIYIFKIDSYPNEYFSGMYGNENTTDPKCVKSHTSYVITFSDYPVLWQPKL